MSRRRGHRVLRRAPNASAPTPDRPGSLPLPVNPAVEALPGLPAQLALGDHQAKQLRRREPVAVRLLQTACDLEPYVEANMIGEFERAHRVPIAEHHALV